MNLYAESSAILAWLLDESSADAVRQLLGTSDLIVASDLTLIECERVLVRSVVLNELTEAEAAERRAHLAAAAAHWHLLRIGPEIVDRALRPYPGEPIRTLDAIHLASLLVGRSAVQELALLSLDERVRQSARGLGVEVVPKMPGPA